MILISIVVKISGKKKDGKYRLLKLYIKLSERGPLLFTSIISPDILKGKYTSIAYKLFFVQAKIPTYILTMIWKGDR